MTTWSGTYVLDGTTVVREALAPTDEASLAERAGRRAAGLTTPEEETVLASRGTEEPWRTADRRLARQGVVYDPAVPRSAGPGGPLERHRAALLLRAERALAEAWDPSVHLEEAVRSLRDIDRAINLIGERVTSWAALDLPEVEGSTPAAAARAVLDRAGATGLSPRDPAVQNARRRLAELLLALEATRTAVDEALRASVPEQAPNLNHLLGPELAARLVAQAGGLDRLAQLPASTVQVLGAERAFFEHLRGRAPPPRHGLLFLHPAVQSAPKAQRGKLARALAAKAAIAARLDRAGAKLDPSLGEAFDRRRAAIRAIGSSAGKRRRGPPLRTPLHGATDDR